MKIDIFTNKDLKIDLPTFIDSRALVCANSGGGKSYCIRKLLEESSGQVMSIVLDVEGEFKTLREKFDFLLIGHDGDVPLNLSSAHLLPEKLMELNVSTILDISDLKKHERILYVKKFLEALMELKRKFWKPCLIVLDEAHLLCGQQEKQESVGAVIDLMTRGRKRGYCGILCTQRIAKLHKDAVAEANNILIGRTGLDIDMRRASEILGFTSKKDMLSLRDLHPGEFYLFGTAISRHVTKSKIKEVKTTHPKVGMDIKSRLSQPTPKIKSMLSKLNDLPKEAEEERKTKQDLQKKIIELKKELRMKSIPQSQTKTIIDEKTTKRLRQQIESLREVEKSYKRGLNQIESETKRFKLFISKLISEGSNLLKKQAPKIEIKPRIQSIPSVPHLRTPLQAPLRIPQKEIREESSDLEMDGEKKLNLCERKIYSFLYANGDRGFTKIQLGAITGYSPKSGSFSNSLYSLKGRRLIKSEGNLIFMDESNPEFATESQEEFSIVLWFKKLGKCPREIFRMLYDNPHDEFTKEEIGEQTGYSSVSGSFSNALYKLSGLGLIKKTGTSIKLNEEILEI